MFLFVVLKLGWISQI